MRSIAVVLGVVMSIGLTATMARAQADASEPAVDKSGTDPTQFLRQVGVRNEYVALPNSDYVNTFSLLYWQPIGEDMNLRLKLPFVASDAAGTADVGLGDFAARYNWLATVTPQYGLLLGAELKADTATEDVLGTGKWVVSPLVTYAWFVNRQLIFAPTYQHDFSFAGDENRADINASVVDLYLVYRAADNQSWYTFDPQIVYNWEGDDDSYLLLKGQYGRTLGTLFGGSLNGYVQPSVGIGADRPYDWGFEIGITVVGF